LPAQDPEKPCMPIIQQGWIGVCRCKDIEWIYLMVFRKKISAVPLCSGGTKFLGWKIFAERQVP
jgi:hypothetical protein